MTVFLNYFACLQVRNTGNGKWKFVDTMTESLLKPITHLKTALLPSKLVSSAMNLLRWSECSKTLASWLKISQKFALEHCFARFISTNVTCH